MTSLLLAQLNAQLEQDMRRIDFLLIACGFFTIFLLMMLSWSIYQYYKTTFKSDLFSKEIRESMKITNDILGKAVNSLNRYDDHYSLDTSEGKKFELQNEAIV